jgi:hypothetical protein
MLSRTGYPGGPPAAGHADAPVTVTAQLAAGMRGGQDAGPTVQACLASARGRSPGQGPGAASRHRIPGAQRTINQLRTVIVERV